MDKYIILVLKYGLCNRLWSILSYSIIANHLNRKLLIYWAEGKDIGFEKFTNIFQPTCEFLTKDELNDICRDSENAKIFHLPICPQYIDKLRGNNKTMEIINNFQNEEKKYLVVPISFGFTPSFFSRKDWLALHYKHSSEIFKPTCVILSKINNFAEKYDIHPDNKQIIGIHIRRTDNRPSIKYSPDNEIEKIISQEIAKSENTKKIYICTDCLETRNKFVKLFGDSIIVYPAEFNSGGLRQTSLSDSFIEMSILSRCSIILCSHGSTFSYYACFMRNIKYFAIGRDSLEDFSFTDFNRF